MHLTAQPDSGKAQILKFNLNLVGDPGCVAFFAGKTYRSVTYCPQQGATYEGARMERVNPGNDTLFISNFRPGSPSLKGLISCDIRTISIPTQIINGITYIGSGSVSINNGSNFPTSNPQQVNVTFQLAETDAGGNISVCSYSLQMLN